eukprot:TRINITY_DN1790_c0_g1_i1.p1 TRINITY_DN1790_c0_g1~~TRINITY_DN1790_c0_g1_i1.p1  ORF type:complete len:79 (-),score=29.41 TRINITY_DN1790_c0_g1_i1:27-263(-)
MVKSDWLNNSINIHDYLDFKAYQVMLEFDDDNENDISDEDDTSDEVDAKMKEEEESKMKEEEELKMKKEKVPTAWPLV